MPITSRLKDDDSKVFKVPADRSDMHISNYIETLREIIVKELYEEDVSIALFGSFAEGTNTEASDIDIAVIPKGKLKRWKLSLLREKLEELVIPYAVDLVDFSMVSESFKNSALKNALWWRT